MGADSDENRAYHFQLLSPLIYFFSKPLIHTFASMDAPYYLLGVVGLANILLLGWIVRRTISTAAAGITVIIYSIYDYPLAYSKMLFYSALHSFFMLTSAILFVEAHNRSLLRLHFISGLMMGLMVLVNPSGIFICIALIVYCVLYEYFSDDRIQIRRTVTRLVIMATGALVAYVGFEVALLFWYKSHPSLEPMSFLKSCRLYSAEAPTFYELGPEYVKNMIWRYWKISFVAEEGGWFRTIFLLAGTSFGVVLAWSRREAGAKALAGFMIFGSMMLITMAFFSLQAFFERMTLWLTVPAAGLTAYTLSVLWTGVSSARRAVIAAACLVFIIFGVQKCLAMTWATYSSTPIHNYLEERGIAKEHLITAFPINRYSERAVGQRSRPLAMLINRDPSAIQNHRSHLIHWPAVDRMYRAEGARYLLTSGIGSQLAYIGAGDPLLASVEPLSEWDHPSNNRHIYPWRDQVPSIKLYDLAEVLERDSARAYVREIERRIRGEAG